jgi:hypothetical protein
VYDFTRQEWLVWTARMNSMSSWSGKEEDRLYFSGGTKKKIYWLNPNATSDPSLNEGEFDPEWQSGFYDLGIDDEKTLVHAKMFGKGNVELQVAEDFGEVGSATTFAMGETLSRADNQMTQSATLFSHRFSGSGAWSVQRFTRYLREVRTPGTKRG